jgi:restriction endonuclease S subunit
MNMGYNERYPLVSIGQIITKSIKPIEIEDNTSYKQITLKTNGGGVVLRDVKQGKNIGTKKQYLVFAGQFIMSKIDARNGAFGVVGPDLDGAIVTADFPVFDVDKERILPDYLALFSTTTSFVRFAKSCSRGTTNRQRIDVNLFLSQKIPLPTLEEQHTLVASYKYRIEQSERLEGQATQIEQSIENYLLSELGIKQKGNIVSEPPTAMVSEPQIEYVVGNQQLEDHGNTRHRGDETNKEYKYLRFVRFKNIEKWGIDYTVGKTPGITITEYPLKRISELCKIGSGGTPARRHKEYYNGTIPWIKTGELHDEILYDTEEKITQQGLENSSAKLYPQGSLVVAMYGATIGKTAKLGVDATTNQACAVLSYIDNNLIQTDYLWIYLQSQTNNLKKMAYGGAQPNINANIISNYLIPIPPISLQNSIVAHINRQKERIKLLKRQADDLRKGALVEFEKEIFE